MEVHHHTHHPKKWKEYFWEFFMLFLAVFCGSLAELQLEHYIEHQRETRFIKQLENDLIADSANLITFLQSQERRQLRIDSLLSIFSNDEQNIKGKETYYHARRILRSAEYEPSDGTITQLKFGANLRLIRPIGLADSIISYDRESRLFVTQLELISQANFRCISSMKSIFDAKIFNSMIDSTNKVNPPKGNPQLLTNNKLVINDFFMELQFIKGGNLRSINSAKALLANNKRMIKLLENHYSFIADKE